MEPDGSPAERLAEAATFCLAEDYLADDGNSIVFADSGLLASSCVIDRLLPEWTATAIGRTTSMMGMVRHEAWGFVTLNTYHPDNGMFLAIYVKEAFE